MRRRMRRSPFSGWYWSRSDCFCCLLVFDFLFRCMDTGMNEMQLNWIFISVSLLFLKQNQKFLFFQTRKRRCSFGQRQNPVQGPSSGDWFIVHLFVSNPFRSGDSNLVKSNQTPPPTNTHSLSLSLSFSPLFSFWFRRAKRVDGT